MLLLPTLLAGWFFLNPTISLSTHPALASSKQSSVSATALFEYTGVTFPRSIFYYQREDSILAYLDFAKRYERLAAESPGDYFFEEYTVMRCHSLRTAEALSLLAQQVLFPPQRNLPAGNMLRQARSDFNRLLPEVDTRFEAFPNCKRLDVQRKVDLLDATLRLAGRLQGSSRLAFERAQVAEGFSRRVAEAWYQRSCITLEKSLLVNRVAGVYASINQRPLYDVEIQEATIFADFDYYQCQVPEI